MSARLSLSDVIERLTERGSQASSVTLSRNAKGDTQWEVKVYTDDAAILSPTDASEVAQALHDALAAKYGYGVNGA